MTTNAASVAAAVRDELRDRVSYLPARKLSALLYLAQTVFLAANDKPLFDERVSTTATGVDVAYLDRHPVEPLDDAQFAAVLVTVSRYGGLPVTDLEAMIRGQGPWQSTPQDHGVDSERIRAWVRGSDDDPAATVTGISRTSMAAMRASEPPPSSATPDSPEEIAAFIADVKARL